MKWQRVLRTVSAGLLSGTLTFAAACVPQGRLYVRVAPPSPVVEVRANAPGAGYIWVNGYHEWVRGNYEWVPGHWVLPPRPRAVWVPGRWERDRRGWYFVDGHWR